MNKSLANQLMPMISLVFLSLGQTARADRERFWPVALPGDSNLDQTHALMPYMRAAESRELPVRYFRELIRAGSAVVVIEGNWPSYKPDAISGGSIYMPSASNPSAWTKNEWSSFYNELFHAWFGNIVRRSEFYRSLREQIHTEERRSHYAQAVPSDPWTAQEEGWSETVGALILTIAPTDRGGGLQYVSLADCAYAIGRTVAPVSHSERPGYRPEAETSYLAPWEYALLFETLTDVPLP